MREFFMTYEIKGRKEGKASGGQRDRSRSCSFIIPVAAPVSYYLVCVFCPSAHFFPGCAALQKCPPPFLGTHAVRVSWKCKR